MSFNWVSQSYSFFCGVSINLAINWMTFRHFMSTNWSYNISKVKKNSTDISELSVNKHSSWCFLSVNCVSQAFLLSFRNFIPINQKILSNEWLSDISFKQTDQLIFLVIYNPLDVFCHLTKFLKLFMWSFYQPNFQHFYQSNDFLGVS